MVPAAGSKNVGVCLVSSHPLFLSQFRETLVKSGFQLHTANAGTKVEGLPHAAVYVVDACAHPRVTEDLVTSIATQTPSARIIVMAESFAEATACSLLKLGVKGVLHYSDAEQQLPRALQAISNGGYWVPRAIMGKLLENISLAGSRARRSAPGTQSPVSRREREILDFLLQNLSNKEIASRMNISERTVKFHVSNLLSKYGVQRRADLILLSYQAGGVHN